MEKFHKPKGTHWHPSSAENDRRLGRRLVLVVDDDRDSRETLALLLTLAGHDVRTAYDGLSALKAAAELQPDIVFLDISMPRLDGYTVCRQLRQSAVCRDTPIYALTGLSGPEHERRCRESGFTALLTKPLEPAALSRLA